MKVLHSIAFALAFAGTVLTSAIASAATQTEAVSLDFSNFVYDSNFWAGRFPGATVGGPAPVTAISLDFTFTYDTPVEDAFNFGRTVPTVSQFAAQITAQDIPGFSQAAQTISATDANFRMQRRLLGGGAAEYDLWGDVKIATNGNTLSDPLVKLTFVLPNFFSGAVLTGTETAHYLYGSPKPFDAPEYAMSTLGTGAFGISRSTVSVQPGPVPLPASLLLGLSGIGALFGMSRKARG